MKKNRLNKDWAEFYRLMADLCEAPPWDYISDTQLFLIHDWTMDRPILVNILGNSGQTRGFVFMKGDDPFNDYFLTLHSEALNLDPMYSLIRLDSFTIYFSDNEDELPDSQIVHIPLLEDTEELFYYGFPYVLRFRPGYYPWSIQEKDLPELNHYLNLFMKALEDNEMYSMWGYGERHGFCNYHKHRNGRFHIDFPPFFQRDYITPLYDIHPEKLFAMKKEFRRTDKNIEVDVRYLPNYISEPGYDQPLSSCICIMADCETGIIPAYHLLNPHEKIEQVIVETYLQYCRKYGIPANILVRSRIFADMLQQSAECMDSSIYVADVLENIEECMEDAEGLLFPMPKTEKPNLS